MNKVEWISVKDRLPRKGTQVLITEKICGVSIMCVAYLDDGWWCNSYGRLIALETDRPIEFETDRAATYWADREVTHWAELPELPMQNS